MSAQWDLIADVVPDDEALQVNEFYYIERVVSALVPGSIVLDLGCGEGKAQRAVTRANPGVVWMGVDLPSSPEVDRRTSPRERLVAFDGVELPFRSASIDCILSMQVLEHVRHPEPLLREVKRVLKPGAPFAGTTSNLEPYHSFSLWNFTPYGFVTIARDAGLEVVELRPGIDGPTLIERQIRGRPPEMSKYFSSTSPRNSEFLDWGRDTHRRPALVNNRMLQFSGHFGFLAQRPMTAERDPVDAGIPPGDERARDRELRLMRREIAASQMAFRAMRRRARRAEAQLVALRSGPVHRVRNMLARVASTVRDRGLGNLAASGLSAVRGRSTSSR